MGAAWILFSDQILPHVLGDLSVASLTRLQTLKGILYVFLTAGFIYLLVTLAARKVTTTQSELERMEHGYLQLFQQTGAVILIVDGSSGVIVDVNRAAEQFYGWSHDALVGRTLREIDASVTESPYHRRSSPGHEHFVSRRQRLASGEERDVELSSTQINAGGRQLECILVHDVTERRVLESQLRQAQKLEAVGQLTSGIAHDLNNVLTVVLADADLIARELPEGKSDVRDDLDDLRTAARRGAAMIRKLLSFSHSVNLTMVTVDLDTAVGRLVPTLKRILPENIEIRYNDLAAGPVRVDQVALEHIVTNLATNAKDAMRGGGHLELETGRTWLAPTDAKPWLRSGSFSYIKVTDSGVGMDAGIRDRMFEPFFTTKPPGEGAGLGMAMTYGLVKQHEGFVFVESKPGKGTTVTVYLPPALQLDAVDSRESETEARYHSSGGETILLVEDEDALRRAGQRILEKLGYVVLRAPNGQRALEILEEQGETIDLVISDLVMPQVGGRALYEAARLRQQDVKFLFTSGHAAAGPDDGAPLPDVPFIQKPWTFDELGRKVREVLNNKAC